jgi:hypothetical protein
MKKTRRDLSCFYEALHYVVVGLAFIVEVCFFSVMFSLRTCAVSDDA